MKTLIIGLLTVGSFTAFAVPSHIIECSNNAIDAGQRNLKINIQSNCGPCQNDTEFIVRLSSAVSGETNTYKVNHVQKVLNSFSIKRDTKTDYFKKEEIARTWLSFGGQPNSSEFNTTLYTHTSDFDAVVIDSDISQSPVTLHCSYSSRGKSFVEVKDYGLTRF